MQHVRSSTDGNRARPMLCAIDLLLVWWCLRAQITTIAVDAVVQSRSPNQQNLANVQPDTFGPVFFFWNEVHLGF